MPRQLIVTADDFGLDDRVNSAIAELAAEGRLTATSLMTTGSRAEEAMALDVPIPVGIHVTLEVEEVRTMPPEEVQAAIEEQVTWFEDRGRRPAHLDLHTLALYGMDRDATLGFGGVVPQALEVAARHALPVRVPRTLPVVAESAQLRHVHAEVLRRADAAGVRLPEVMLTDLRPAPMISSYEDLREQYRAMLCTVPSGISEMFLHPAIPCDATAEEPDARKRAWEYELLASGDLHRAGAEHGIALTHW